MPRLWLILVVSALASNAYGRGKPCVEQDYSNSKKAPDWRCEGPDESVLVPDLKTRPSLGLPAGSSVTKKGDKAPTRLGYPAVVMDKDRVIQLGLKIQGLRRLRWLERHKNKKLVEIEKKYMTDRLTAKLTLEKSRTSVLKTHLAKTKKELISARKWYRSWTFGLVVGVLTTTAAVIAAAFAVK